MTVFTCAIGDTGGANCVAPIARRLGERGHDVRVFINEALARNMQNLPDFGRPFSVLDDSTLDGLCIGEGGILVATASREGNREKRLIRNARSQGWPTVSPVENWGPFYSRFCDIENGSFTNQLAYLPDHVLVVDPFARDRAIEEGVPADNITVAGSPHLEQVVTAGKTWSKADTARLCEQLDIDPGKPLVLFASQALRKEMGRNSPEFPGYDEFDCLTLACEGIAAEWPDAAFVVKLHPFETRKEFHVPDAAERLSFRIVEDIPAWDIARSADLVMGANTMLLMEAVVWEKLVISIQPNAIRPTDFIGTRIGALHTCTDINGLRQTLRQRTPLSTDASTGLRRAAAGATDRITEFLERLTP